MPRTILEVWGTGMCKQAGAPVFSDLAFQGEEAVAGKHNEQGNCMEGTADMKALGQDPAWRGGEVDGREEPCAAGAEWRGKWGR